MARGGKSKNLSGGLPLPDEVLDDYPRVCVVFQCPDEPEIVRSVLGHIWDLGRWDVWEKGGYGDTRATRMARQFKSILLDTLRIRECDEMSACCDNLLSEVRQIKALLAAIERRQAQDDAATIINNYTSYWNNPATVLEDQYPDAPDVTLEQKTGDTPQQQARRVDALCYLARVLVDMAYEAYRRDKASSSFLANLAVSVSGLVLSVAMFFSKLTGWGLAMSLILGLAKVSQDTKDQITAEDLADATIQKTIQCKLRSALRGASPTAASVKAAVTAMPDGAAGMETRMTQAVREAIVNTDDTALQNSVKAALSDAMSPVNVLPSCDCPTNEFTGIFWDFSNGYITETWAITQQWVINYGSLAGINLPPDGWGIAVLELQIDANISKVEPTVWFNVYGVTRTRIYIDDILVLESTEPARAAPIPITWTGNRYAGRVKIVVTDEGPGGWAGIKTITIE